MDVVFSIQGRKALPVWVLPFVTSWELSPDALVAGLINPRNNPSNTFPAAFKLNTLSEPTHLPSEQWKTTKIQINSLDEQLRNDGKPTIQSLAKWHTDSIHILQRYKAFVWLDEFQKWFDKTHYANKLFDLVGEEIVEKPGLTICLSPLLDEDFVRCLEVEKAETESHEGQSKNLSNIDNNELDRGRTKAVAEMKASRTSGDISVDLLLKHPIEELLSQKNLDEFNRYFELYVWKKQLEGEINRRNALKVTEYGEQVKRDEKIAEIRQKIKDIEGHLDDCPVEQQAEAVGDDNVSKSKPYTKKEIFEYLKLMVSDQNKLKTLLFKNAAKTKWLSDCKLGNGYNLHMVIKAHSKKGLLKEEYQKRFSEKELENTLSVNRP